MCQFTSLLTENFDLNFFFELGCAKQAPVFKFGNFTQFKPFKPKE